MNVNHRINKTQVKEPHKFMEAIRTARQLVDQGWTQGGFLKHKTHRIKDDSYDDAYKNPYDYNYCARGAIITACEIAGLSHTDRIYLRWHIDSIFKRFHSTPERPKYSIECWNDDADRKKKDVVDLVDKALVTKTKHFDPENV